MSIPHGSCDTTLWSQLLEHDTPIFAGHLCGDQLVFHFQGIDSSTAVGRMIMGIFAALAEYELELIHERQRAAAEAARARGKHVGRPRALNADAVRMARAMIDAGEPVTMVCAALSVGRSTLYRALRQP